MSSISVPETGINTNPAEDDGLGIGSLSLTENCPSSDNKCVPDTDHNDNSDSEFHWPERDWDADIYVPCTPPSSDDGILNMGTLTGPCLICGLAHEHEVCEYRYFCPIEQEVGEGFVVVCPCNANVENGKCPRGCSYKTGRAAPMYTLKNPSIFFSYDEPNVYAFPMATPCGIEPSYEEREGDNIFF